MPAKSLSPRKIVIIDDHPLVREGIQLRLALHPQFEVVGQAGSESEALAIVKREKPDLATVDISLKTGDGIALLKQIKRLSPRTKLLVVSSYQESAYGERCLRAGANGFLNKQESAQDLIKAIEVVLAGEHYISPKLASRLVAMCLTGIQPSDDPTELLTNREAEIFRLIGEGRSSSQLAKQLMISIHTVDTHRENIKRKLGLKNAPELTRVAVQWVLEHKN